MSALRLVSDRRTFPGCSQNFGPWPSAPRPGSAPGSARADAVTGLRCSQRTRRASGTVPAGQGAARGDVLPAAGLALPCWALCSRRLPRARLGEPLLRPRAPPRPPAHLLLYHGRACVGGNLQAPYIEKNEMFSGKYRESLGPNRGGPCPEPGCSILSHAVPTDREVPC